jgi:DNA replication licensing factor MCM7
VKVYAKGINTRKCTPGDIVTITGVYMPSPYTGFQGARAGLNHETFIECYKIVKDKQNFKETILTDEMVEKVFDIKNSCENDYDLYRRMANSICPEIFSMDEIK